MKTTGQEDSSQMLHHPMRQWAAMAAIALLAGICIYIPAYVFTQKIYAYHLKQPETIQGGLELLVLFIVSGLAACCIRRSSLVTIVIAVLAGLYLQVHSILLTAALGLLFLEALMQIGGAVLRLFRLQDPKACSLQAYLARFIVGISAWIVGALLFSACGSGSIAFLRFYSIVLASAAIASAPSMPLSLTLVEQFERANNKDRVLILFLLALILTQFGKANFGTDYDSAWYGLRPERVLIGTHSLFDSLKLTHFVYYYPKQFEILTLPLAELNRGIYIVAFNVFLLGIVFLTTYRLGKELGLGRTSALFITALVGSIPAVSNMASTAKSDNLIALYAYLAALFFWQWCKGRTSLDLSLALTSVLGMMSTKITAYAYAPVLAFGFILTGILLHRSAKNAELPGSHPDLDEKPGLRSYVPVILGACNYGGLAFRTWLLTGIPTMPAFVTLWKILGLTPRYPWNSSQFGFLGVPINSPGDFFTHWYKLLFDPYSYAHYAMSWPGNIAFFAICVLLILAVIRSIPGSRQTGFLCACIPIMACGIFMACLLRRHGDGSTDGNYYTIPVVLTVFAVAGILSRLSGKLRIAVITCGAGFILLHLLVMFVSHWSWHPGTQAFKFSLQKPQINAEAGAEAALRDIGAWEIEEYLRVHPQIRLCVGFSRGEERTLRSLSCTHEDFEQIGGTFPHLFETASGFRQYLAWARPDMLIMPKSTSFSPGKVDYNVWLAFQELSGNPGVTRVESAKYSALDLSAIKSELSAGNPVKK